MRTSTNPPKPRKPKKPTPTLEYAQHLGDPIVIDIPLVTKSESNMRGSWGSKEKRRTEATEWGHTAIFAAGLTGRGLEFETIRLIRFGINLLDPGNLAVSFKYVQDGIARQLGIDDSGDQWRYSQQKSLLVGVRIELARWHSPRTSEPSPSDTH